MLGSILSCLVGGILCAPFWFTPPAASDKNAAVEPSGTDMQVMCVVAEAMEPTTRPASLLPHRPAKKVVVLLGEGGFLPDAKDAETSPMLRSLFERARSPFKLDDPFRLGRIEITRRALREQDAASSGPRERTAFVMMWLPGYSPDRREAVVYAWVSYGGEDSFEGRGLYYYLRFEHGRWRVAEWQEVWIT